VKATYGNNRGVVSNEGLVLNHVVVENQGVELGMSKVYMVQLWYCHNPSLGFTIKARACEGASQK